MAWQSRVKDMERSFETAESTILAARVDEEAWERTGSTATMTRAGATMTRDANDAGEGEHARGRACDHVGRFSRALVAGRDARGRGRGRGRDIGVGRAERRQHETRRGVEDEGVHGVPGMEDFGPAVDADVERPVMRRMRPKGETRAPRRCCARSVDAAARFGRRGGALRNVSRLGRVRRVRRDGRDGPARSVATGFRTGRPDRGLDDGGGEAGGESATAALLDVEREIGAAADGRRADGLCVRGDVV